MFDLDWVLQVNLHLAMMDSNEKFDSSLDLFEEEFESDIDENCQPTLGLVQTKNEKVEKVASGHSSNDEMKPILKDSSVDRSIFNVMKDTSDGVSLVDEMSDNELANSICLLEASSNSSGLDLQHADSDSPERGETNLEQESSHSLNKTVSPNYLQPTDCDGGNFACPVCSVEETSLKSLQNHLALGHQEFSQQTAKEEQSDSSCVSVSSCNPLDVNSISRICDDLAIFTCPFCDVNLDNAVVLYQHVNQMHEDLTEATGSFSCPLCSFKCDFEHEMKEHVKIHESDSTCTYFGVSSLEAPLNKDVVASEAGIALACPMCGLCMSDTDLLTSHVETHFSPQHSPEPSSGAYSKVLKNRPSNILGAKIVTSQQDSSHSLDEERGSFRQQHDRGLERAFMRGEISVGEYHEQRATTSRIAVKDIDDGQTRVPGLVEKISELFRRQSRLDQRVYLCSPTDHFCASYGDKGWGCGYRNLQMMLSCLVKLPDFAHRLAPMSPTTIPSIPRVQEMIEEAWREGFDPQGCRQLGGRVVRTRKWIGATEIMATLSALRIKCQLVDFHCPSAPDGSHPRLFQWVTNYFCDNTPEKPPLYLQHQGHSRTIIGVERENGVNKLLIFDPGNPNMAVKSSLTWKDMRTFRRTQSGFKARQYQIVAVVGLLSEHEYQESKVLRSERIS